MNKRVYSIVLSDDVVAAVDSMAYSMNTSRSNLINQILAQHCSYVTPEKQMQDIFDYVRYNLADCFKIIDHASNSMFSAGTAINFKYNPTAKYSVELMRGGNGLEGILKVSFRTQSRSFIEYLSVFFRIWTSIEKAYTGNNLWEMGENRFARRLHLTKNAEKVISDYINSLDKSIKIFFANLENIDYAAELIENEYCRRNDL